MDDFDWCVEFILKVEGGYTDNPDDLGNYTPDGLLLGTKYGISARSYPHLDIPNLTPDEAKQVYYQDFWLPTMEYVSPFAPVTHKLAVFDMAVNSGVSRAVRFWSDANQDLNSFIARRIRFYVRLEKFSTFGRGWMNRIADLSEYMAGHGTTFRRVFLLFGPLQVPLPYKKASVVLDKLYIRVW